ncbi:PIG-L family deacetylase [Nonomuraea sp. NPDC059194]|uniref:PIG-L family deacetylase n=1 Tax=Nonomuraea sp. NPDC059194 TaxID=3346764 RepID=UPI0036A924CD
MAHQDDDLLFINPAISGDHDAGACLRVVYLTAGDAGRTDGYVGDREAGVRAAYALMAGAPDTWQRSDVGAVRGYSLGGGKIQLLFLGLPDGYPRGRGSRAQGRQSLLKLFRGDLDHITTVDGTARYDERTLVATLRELVERFRPDTVRTLDHQSTRLGFSLTEPVDHSDHAVTARYTALAVRQAMAATPGLRPAIVFYRGYGITTLPANLGPGERARKSEIFAAYVGHAGCKAGPCPAGTLAAGDREWVARQYRREPPSPAPGTIVSWMGGTDAPNDDATTARCLAAGPGGAVRTHACDGTPAQRWHVRAASLHSASLHSATLRGSTHQGVTLRSAMNGRCLSARRTPALAACDGGKEQRWQLAPGGLISTSEGCLHQDDLLARHPRLRLAACDRGRPEQRWFHALEARPPAP